MKRPRPVITKKNLYKQYMSKTRQIAKHLASEYNGIMAIAISGGVARGFADKASD